MEGEIEIEVNDGVISLKPVASAREGWEAAFEVLAHGSDEGMLLPAHGLSRWEDSEWEW